MTVCNLKLFFILRCNTAMNFDCLISRLDYTYNNPHCHSDHSAAEP